MSINYGYQPIVTNGLVLHLDAANPNSYRSGSTTWNDLSGNRNNGTLVNGPGYSSANFGSITFDGVNDYVATSNQIQFDRLNPFTISSWINLNSVSAVSYQIINNENTSSYTGYQITINQGGYIFFSFRSTITDRIQIQSSNPIIANTWYNVLGTYNGSSTASGMSIYINGLLTSTTSISNNLTSTTISNETTWIGYRRPSSQGPFDGKISTAQIYNRALSASEVQQNYNALKSRYGL